MKLGKQVIEEIEILIKNGRGDNYKKLEEYIKEDPYSTHIYLQFQHLDIKEKLAKVEMIQTIFSKILTEIK